MHERSFVAGEDRRIVSCACRHCGHEFQQEEYLDRGFPHCWIPLGNLDTSYLCPMCKKPWNGHTDEEKARLENEMRRLCERDGITYEEGSEGKNYLNYWWEATMNIILLDHMKEFENA